jgi:Acyl-CoA dehydrogenase, C-terminal domain
MYRAAMSWSHDIGRGIVGSMFDIASTSAIERGGVLDRLLRDIATACQHRIVHTRVYAPAGRLLLGLPSGDPTV